MAFSNQCLLSGPQFFYVGTGKWERWHHSFHSKYDHLYSSFKEMPPTIPRKEHYFPFSLKFEDIRKRGKDTKSRISKKDRASKEGKAKLCSLHSYLSGISQQSPDSQPGTTQSRRIVIEYHQVTFIPFVPKKISGHLVFLLRNNYKPDRI